MRLFSASNATTTPSDCHVTPRVQGEPIVPGSDFGLFASEEAKDFIFWYAFLFIATGAFFMFFQ